MELTFLKQHNMLLEGNELAQELEMMFQKYSIEFRERRKYW
jgi:hypothetical protein